MRVIKKKILQAQTGQRLEPGMTQPERGTRRQDTIIDVGRLLRRNFFFSSRRRHTRSLCDWSSDVCSSDLPPGGERHRPRRARPGGVAARGRGARRAAAPQAERRAGRARLRAGRGQGADFPVIRWDDAPGPYEVVFSTREGGVSEGPFASLNLGRATADEPERVDENRRRLCAEVGADLDALTMNYQHHSA